MSQVSSALAPDVAGRARFGVRVLLVGLVVGLCLQRLALWAGGYPFPVTLLVLPMVVALLAPSGVMRLHPGRLAAYLVMFCSVTLSFLLNAATASPFSYALLVGLYGLLCFQAPLPEPAYRSYYAGVVKLTAALAVVGIAQFLLQFVVAEPARLFTWRSFMPSDFLVEYATLNRLSYASTIFKSNGWVFLEPSAFSQFLARVILISLMLGVQRRWLPFLGLALLLTYAGTGLILLAVFAPAVLIASKLWRGLGPKEGLLLMLAAVALLAVGPLSLDLLRFEFISNRLHEVFVPGSSGYARFGATSLILNNAFSGEGAGALLFGLGPGETDRFISGYRVELFATAWVKALIEYGVCGLGAIAVFATVCLYSATRSAVLTAALLFQFFMLDGNLLVPQHVMLLAFLGVYVARAGAAPPDALRDLDRRPFVLPPRLRPRSPMRLRPF